MNYNKILICIFLSIFIASAFAQYPSLPTDTGQKTTTSYSLVQLYQGWNLVKTPINTTADSGSQAVCGQQASSFNAGRTAEDFSLVYIYDPFNKKYLRKNSAEWQTFSSRNPDYFTNS